MRVECRVGTKLASWMCGRRAATTASWSVGSGGGRRWYIVSTACDVVSFEERRWSGRWGEVTRRRKCCNPGPCLGDGSTGFRILFAYEQAVFALQMSAYVPLNFTGKLQRKFNYQRLGCNHSTSVKVAWSQRSCADLSLRSHRLQRGSSAA